VIVVVAGICFAWACIATAVLIAQSKATTVWREASVAWKANYEMERDRAQASSLAEFRTYHPTDAMPADLPEDGKQYAYDATGLVRVEIPASE
jgi:hypothetical protein